jgi:hypothetical protein
MIGVRSRNDLYVGLFLVGCAVIGFWLTKDLRVGTGTRMGPGYMPMALCWVLAVLGVITLVRGFLVDGPDAERWKLRPVLVISVSIAYFAFAIERLGLVLAIFGLVMIGSLADTDSKRWESLALAIGLAVFCVLVFAKALGLPMQLWPEGLR